MGPIAGQATSENANITGVATTSESVNVQPGVVIGSSPIVVGGIIPAETVNQNPVYVFGSTNAPSAEQQTYGPAPTTQSPITIGQTAGQPFTGSAPNSTIIPPYAIQIQSETNVTPYSTQEEYYPWECRLKKQ